MLICVKNSSDTLWILVTSTGSCQCYHTRVFKCRCLPPLFGRSGLLSWQGCLRTGVWCNLFRDTVPTVWVFSPWTDVSLYVWSRPRGLVLTLLPVLQWWVWLDTDRWSAANLITLSQLQEPLVLNVISHAVYDSKALSLLDVASRYGNVQCRPVPLVESHLDDITGNTVPVLSILPLIPSSNLHLCLHIKFWVWHGCLITLVWLVVNTVVSHGSSH